MMRTAFFISVLFMSMIAKDVRSSPAFCHLRARKELIKSQRSSVEIFSLKGGMRPKPKEMALKMWESLRTPTRFWSNPGGGGESFLPTGPGSAELWPWHMVQLMLKSSFPRFSESAVGITGLFRSIFCETGSRPVTGTLPAGGISIGA